jgi:hypothetical protein
LSADFLKAHFQMTRLDWLTPFLLFVAVATASDLGVNVGSKAASQLISQGVHSALQKPRKLNIEMLSAKNPWFEPIAHIDTNARVLVHDLHVRFHDDLVDVRMTNVSVSSKSNVVLPLPFFLGEDVAIINAQVRLHLCCHFSKLNVFCNIHTQGLGPVCQSPVAH